MPLAPAFLYNNQHAGDGAGDPYRAVIAYRCRDRTTRYGVGGCFNGCVVPNGGSAGDGRLRVGGGDILGGAWALKGSRVGNVWEWC